MMDIKVPVTGEDLTKLKIESLTVSPTIGKSSVVKVTRLGAPAKETLWPLKKVLRFL